MIVGIDFGKRHCGIALSRSYLAEAIATIPTSQVVSYLQEIQKKELIEKIVLGMSEGETALEIDKFALILKNHGFVVDFIDETLSSYETRVKMAQKGIKRSLRQGKTDHFVAARLLEEYLAYAG